MIDEETRNRIIALIHQEVVPAIGCTEPICVALCTAKATEQLGTRPEKIEAFLSANILKNAMGVGIPGTGMIGLPIAIALGALIGKSEYQLEVLKDLTPESLAEGKRYVSENRIVISQKEGVCEKLYAEEVDLEDLTNHAVVVTHVTDDIVTIFDPYEAPYIVNIPLPNFLNAWKESQYYMIQVLQSVDEYVPHPIDVDNIPLDGELEELQEAIAENAHDVWAEARMKEGWSYGKERDDANRKHPDLIPYTALPDSEKQYDRIMAFNTIKLVKKLGYDIMKRNR